MFGQSSIRNASIHKQLAMGENQGSTKREGEIEDEEGGLEKYANLFMSQDKP